MLIPLPARGRDWCPRGILARRRADGVCCAQDAPARPGAGGARETILLAWSARLGLSALALSYVLLLAAYFAALGLGLGRQGWLALVREFTLYLFLPAVGLALLALLLRAWAALALALLPIALVAAVYAPRFLPPAAPAVAGPTVRVLSFNAGGNAGGGALDPLLGVVRAVDADLVALQEIPPGTLPALLDALAAGYPYQEGTTDALILSRWPLADRERFYLQDNVYGAEQVRVIVDGHWLTLTNVHLTRPRYRIQWRREIIPTVRGYNPTWRDSEVEELVMRLRAVEGPQVLTGDFNETEWSHPYLVLAGTLRDSFRDGGQGLGHTYPSQIAWRGRHFSLPLVRIDYIFRSPDLAVRRAWVGPFGGSDHLPVVADLVLP